MGVASMVIGIVALLVGFIPFCGAWAVLPAVVGIALGIAELIVKTKRNEGKGMAIAGLVLNPLAIIVIVIWWVIAAMAAHEATNSLNTTFQQQMMQLQTTPGLQQANPNVPTVPLPPSAGAPQLQPMQPAPVDTAAPPQAPPAVPPASTPPVQ
jgi:hypothetical protein